MFDHKEFRSKRREAGLCIECGEPSPERVRCGECRRRGVEVQKRAIERKAKSGRCRMCGQANEAKGKYCDGCKEKARKSSRNWQSQRRAAGKCIACGGDNPAKGSRCEDCRKKNLESMAVARRLSIEQGLCRQCRKPAIPSTRSLRGRERAGTCETCYLKILASSCLGSQKQWKVLKDKLDACGWKCYYTGETLVLGDNLSFDHVYPVCRFPEQRFDPDNIRPCSWQINLMKRDLTEQEFLNLIWTVIRNREQQE